MAPVTSASVKRSRAANSTSSLSLAGWGSVLLGGCPLRQLILAGEGHSDSAVTVAGLITGAAIAHNFSLASSAKGPTANGQIAVALGFVGVAIILAPRLTVLDNGLEVSASLGAVLVLMSACFAALAQVFIRNLVRSESTTAIVFWFTISSACFSLLTIPFGWVLPDPATFGDQPVQEAS